MNGYNCFYCNKQATYDFKKIFYVTKDGGDKRKLFNGKYLCLKHLIIAINYNVKYRPNAILEYERIY